MSIHAQCRCGRHLKAPDEYAGARADCPFCGQTVTFPPLKPAPPVQPPPVVERSPAAAQAAEQPPSSPAASRARKPHEPDERIAFVEEPLEVVEFLDPPTASVPEKEETRWFRQMFEALLDPRSIQWMLFLGGGLIVLGLIVFLYSLGVFENPRVLAVILGAGSLAILGAGWYVALKTKYRIAGQALTFLGCVVLPLNLWFYHAQGLILTTDHLWLGGVMCCLLYVGTVWVLRDSLFMYAVEVGVTLTVLLLLADLGRVDHAAHLSLALMALALISMHAERAFPTKGSVFTRNRFGMPLFWSGHAQLGAALLILLGFQALGWVIEPARQLFGDPAWLVNSLTGDYRLAAGLWLAGTYAYLYSDIVVRRVGVYTYLAAFCLVLMEVTLVGYLLDASAEVLIATLALTALAATIVHRLTGAENEKLHRAVPPLAIILSALPILFGGALHLRATSELVRGFWPNDPQSSWPLAFVLVMLVVAATNRVSAYLYRHSNARMSAIYFFFSAAGLIVAAAGLAPLLGLKLWYQQAPLLMLIPLGYLIAARLWRGHTPERPLGWVAHTATAVILAHVLAGSLDVVESVLRPIRQDPANLLLGLVFVEAGVFYVLAAYFRRRSLNVYFAMAAFCGAMWQLLGYWGVSDAAYYTMLYAVLGGVFLIIARILGLHQIPVYEIGGQRVSAIHGKGLPAYQGGNAVLLVAFLAAFLQALVRRVAEGEPVPDRGEWFALLALVTTTLVSVAAIWLVLPGPWRRLYATSSVALAAVTFLTLNVLVELNSWQKLEIFCVTVGVALLIVSYIARFRETDREAADLVTVGFWLGSVLATLPLLAAVVYHRSYGQEPSLYDELAILTVTILTLITGLSWQVKSTTLIGGSTLTLYLILMICDLAYHPQVAVGVYLAIGGAVVFVCGITLSIYREQLLALPERIAKREGIFRVMDWR